MRRAQTFAALVLGGFGAFCLAVLTLAVVRRSDTLFYYIAPIVGLMLVGFALRARAEIRINLSVGIVAVGLTLYGAELVLLFTQQSPTRPEFEQRRIDAARARGQSYDLRSQLEVVMDLEEQGVHAVARVHPSEFVSSNGLRSGRENIFPVSGIARTVTVTCNESGEWTLFESDEHGFRNPLGQYGRDSIDIVLVGDSYAFGACVPQGEGVASALRQTGRSVLNLAYGGNGPLLKLAALKEYGEPFAPQAVLWLYHEGTDLWDLRRERRSSLLLNYLDPDYTQRLSEKQPLIDSLLIAYHSMRREKAEARLRRRGRCGVTLCRLRELPERAAPQPPAADLPVDFLEDVLVSARDRVRRWDGELFFVYLPGWGRYSSAVAHPAFDSRPQILERVRESGIPIIDFTGVLDSHPDPLSVFPFRERGHYTAQGYKLLAGQIASRLDGLAH